jgi:hypothetical protein
MVAVARQVMMSTMPHVRACVWPRVEGLGQRCQPRGVGVVGAAQSAAPAAVPEAAPAAVPEAASAKAVPEVALAMALVIKAVVLVVVVRHVHQRDHH